MANNPNHLKNLKPFNKGEDNRRNVTGENKKIPGLDDLLAEILSEPVKGIPTAKAIIITLRDKAIKGDIRAAEILLDRAYGKARQSVQHEAAITLNDSREKLLKNLTDGELAEVIKNG